MQRVEKTGGSNPAEVVYFNGQPIALLNPSGNSWTDLIWAGSSLIAEVPGSQSATPVYRLLDHEGSLAATANSAGGILATNLFTPYGQLMNSGAGDAYSWTGLFQDTEYSGDAAWYRNYSTRQARWLTPDPYNGSYDPYNPQSFNRYSYVNGNPLGYTDPSGLAGAGVFTGIGGNLCSGWGISGINPCDPVASVVSIGLSRGADVLFPSLSLTAGQFTPFIGFGLTIGCNFLSNSDMCGQSGWTAAVFTGKNKWVGTAVNDVIAYAELAEGLALNSAASAAGVSVTSYLASCITGPSNPVCDLALAAIAYTALNDIFSVFWNLFGPPKFTGSLLPRPSDFGGLGTSPIGIPNQNLSLKSLLKQ